VPKVPVVPYSETTGSLPGRRPRLSTVPAEQVVACSKRRFEADQVRKYPAGPSPPSSQDSSR